MEGTSNEEAFLVDAGRKIDFAKLTINTAKPITHRNGYLGEPLVNGATTQEGKTTPSMADAESDSIGTTTVLFSPT
jgi:hypothetical protein